jgi:GNAT superfamily N-acetyltransferase
MHSVRMAVRENRLTSGVITEQDYVDTLSAGQGWIIEEDGQLAGFAIANAATANVWALFVDPAHEGRGHGRQLHDAMIEWMTSQPVARWWLTTEAGTRAERFYERAGWTRIGVTGAGEVRFERTLTRRT